MKYEHSPWDQVYNHIPGVCDCYFGGNIFWSAELTAANKTAAVENVTAAGWYGNEVAASQSITAIGTTSFTVSDINAVLPITDLLAFQCFPTGLGDIMLKFFVNNDDGLGCL